MFCSYTFLLPPLYLLFRRRGKNMRKRQRNITAPWKSFWICLQKRRSHSYKRYLSLPELSHRYVTCRIANVQHETDGKKYLFSLKISVFVFYVWYLGDERCWKACWAVSFHWRALLQQFSWLVWKGNVYSLVLFCQGQTCSLYCSLGNSLCHSAVARTF